MNVLSLFDGISCGQVALQRAGIPVNKYYASEIVPTAIKVTQSNFPKTIQFGDVRRIKAEHFLSPINLLMGGSPCQGFSFAGKGLNFEDPRSKLFFEFVRLKKELNPDYFFLENVRMKKEREKVITDILGVEPYYVNSALVSAQNRYRLYWTNIPGFTMPEDRGIFLKDILEFDNKGYVKNNGNYREVKKASCLDASYYKGIDNHAARTCVAMTERRTEEAKAIRRESNKNGSDFSPRRAKELVERSDNKANCLTAAIGKEQIVKISNCIVKGSTGNGGFEQRNRIYHADGKAPTLTGSQGGDKEPNLYINEDFYRKLTVTECERLQGLPDKYTKAIAKSPAYHALGNGWQVDTIVEFFKNLPKNI